MKPLILVLLFAAAGSSQDERMTSVTIYVREKTLNVVNLTDFFWSCTPTPLTGPPLKVECVLQKLDFSDKNVLIATFPTRVKP